MTWQDVLTGNIKPAISEIRQMLNSPIKFYDPTTSTKLPQLDVDTTSSSDQTTTPTPSSCDPQVAPLASCSTLGDNVIAPKSLSENLSGKPPLASAAGGQQSSLGPSSSGEGGDTIVEGDLPGQITRLLGKSNSFFFFYIDNFLLHW